MPFDTCAGCQLRGNCRALRHCCLKPDPLRSPQLVDRAFEIADEAMFELIDSECVANDEFRVVLGLTDESQMEVHTLQEAAPAIREAFEWLQPRGYVELGQDEDGQYIQVVRRPGED